MCIEENIHQLSPVEEDPAQIGLCVESTTPCVSPRIEVRSEVLLIVVSEGRKDSSRNNQSSGSSTSSQNHIVSPGMNTTQSMMARVDPTLRMYVFDGVGLEDPEQHLFVSKVIWTMKNVQDDYAKIV